MAAAAVALATIFAQCPAAELALSDALDPQWMSAPLWDDGRAEIAVFDAQRVVDGRPIAHDCTLVTTKEDFTKAYWTRADWPYGDKPVVAVLRQSQLSTIPDASFPTHWATTFVFERAGAPKLAKMTLSSQDADASSFKEFQLWRETPTMRFASPWDGEGTGERTLPLHGANVRFEEELPLLVRMLKFEDGLQARFELEPSQQTSKAPAPIPSQAILTVVRPANALATSIGRFEPDAAWLVVVETRDGRSIDFLVEDAPPNRLLGWSHADGRRLTIKSVERRKQQG